jgi:hypothetical protein
MVMPTCAGSVAAGRTTWSRPCPLSKSESIMSAQLPLRS